MENKLTKPASKGCAITSVVIIALLMIGLIYVISIPQTHNQYDDLSICVQVFADDMIQAQLKYPDGWSYESKKVTRKDSTLYNFQAIVLAKNGFGIRSRLCYSLQIRFDGSIDDSYKNAADRRYWTIVKNELNE
ncbi:MAG: hypothetical protein LBB85_07175 [Dysgonamonadaceae bacterium]|jgi:hypothetical protein|nr:hypothetical protein [Dysgonamonadaceae bacterium]